MSISTEEKGHVAHASAMRYVLSVGALYVLTALTFWLSGMEFGSWSLVIALIIACTKATIVAMFFMHLYDHRGASRLVFVVSILFLVVAIAFVLIENTTRFPLSLPPHSLLNPDK
jgi:cytochrome c oxidase subunit 4